MQAFTPDNYKAFGSFRPIYIEVERWLFQQRDWPLDRVFRTLVDHTDPRGCTYISPWGMSQFSGLALTTVAYKLRQLGDLGWLRVHVTDNPARHQQQIDWQVSPALIWISPDHIAAATDIWAKARPVDTPEIWKGGVWGGKESQKETFNQTQNYTENHHHHQNQSLQTAAPENEGKDQAEQEYDPPNQREAPTASGASRTEPAAQNGRSAAPPPPDLDSCRAPLADHEAEAMAVTVSAELSTRIVQARQLVLWFGILRVRNALTHLARDTANGWVPKSKFGLVRSWLLAGIEDDSAAADPLDGTGKPRGKYADFIRS